MENPRTRGGMEHGATFGYVGRARAAPVLARALHRLVDGGGDRERVAILLPNRSETAWRTIEGSPRRCRDWLVDTPTDSGVGVVCVAPPSSAALPGFALRGHLSVAAVGRPTCAHGRRVGVRPAAECLADLVQDLWIPPLQLSVSRVLAGLGGDFHLIAMTANEPDRIVCASRGSTLCLGVSEDGVIVGSEPNAVLSDTGGVVFLHAGEIGVLDTEGWDLLEADALARLRRPVEDLARYRQWARRRTMLRSLHATPVVDPHVPTVVEPRGRGRASDDKVRRAQGGR